jgi:AraC family transcriptional regulator
VRRILTVRLYGRLGKIAILFFVKNEPVPFAAHFERRPPGAPIARRIASGDGWSAAEFVCTLGPKDRPFEEGHTDVAISAVMSGTFRYRTETGDALLHPGALLLGNRGACFECGHDHEGGDRCIAFHYAPELFEEIAAATVGSHRYRFRVATLPALRLLDSLIVDLEATTRRHQPIGMDELAIRLAENVLRVATAKSAKPARPTGREQRRIGAVVRFIEEHASELIDLTMLAEAAFMSRYHFVRTFRKVVGVSPHQFLLGVRLRRAAQRLDATLEPIVSIALDAGFSDLSTFGKHFRNTFGVNPTIFRATRRHQYSDQET